MEKVTDLASRNTPQNFDWLKVDENALKLTILNGLHNTKGTVLVLVLVYG